MGSEALVNTQIFFKDKQNDLKGPFTERQVQEWYRKKWFDNSFPFCFMKEGETPCEDTEFLTLETLRTHNGIGCPFKAIEVKENDAENREERLITLEMEVAYLSNQCDEVKKLEKKIEEIERKLRVLSVQHSTTIHEAVEKAKEAEDNVEPHEENAQTKLSLSIPSSVDALPECVEKLVDFYLRVCDNLSEKYLPSIPTFLALAMENYIVEAYKSTEIVNILVDELARRIEEKPYLFCAFCDRLMFTARQTFMHMADSDHVSKRSCDYYTYVNSLLQHIVGVERVQDMYKHDTERVQSQQLKWSSMSLEDPELRPDRAVVDFVQGTTGFCGIDFLSAEKSCKTKSEWAQWLIPYMRADDKFGRFLMNGIEEVIGNARARCFSCRLIFANIDEYFDHLLTYFHLRSTDPFDYFTLVVNVQKRHLARL